MIPTVFLSLLEETQMLLVADKLTYITSVCSIPS
jgi:hypothetical protein